MKPELNNRILDTVRSTKGPRGLPATYDALRAFEPSELFETLFAVSVFAQGGAYPVAFAGCALFALNPPCSLTVNEAVGRLMSEWGHQPRRSSVLPGEAVWRCGGHRGGGAASIVVTGARSSRAAPHRQVLDRRLSIEGFDRLSRCVRGCGWATAFGRRIPSAEGLQRVFPGLSVAPDARPQRATKQSLTRHAQRATDFSERQLRRRQTH